MGVPLTCPFTIFYPLTLNALVETAPSWAYLEGRPLAIAQGIFAPSTASIFCVVSSE